MDARLDDRQRPLNKRGLRDAPMMGERFKQRGESLDLVLISPATRTRITANLFIKAAGMSQDLICEEDDLYFSSLRSVEDIIHTQNTQAESLMLVFHNPDITHFVNSIDAAHRIVNVPTCGLIKLASDIDRWQDWSVAKTEFLYFDYPKKLSS